MNPLFQRGANPAPGLLPLLMGLGIYPEPQGRSPVYGELSSQDPEESNSSSVADIEGQIAGAARYFGGDRGEEHHTQRNFSRNSLGVPSPMERLHPDLKPYYPLPGELLTPEIIRQRYGVRR
jgi:hypothetical protein